MAMTLQVLGRAVKLLLASNGSLKHVSMGVDAGEVE